MNRNPLHNSPLSLSQTRMIAKAELLQRILESELHADSPYPWNPEAAENYLQSLEAHVPEMEFPEPEADAFFSSLEGLWAAPDVPMEAAQSEQLSLSDVIQQLAGRTLRVPQGAIAKMLEQVDHLMDSQLSAVDRLVACVQDCLPQWDAEDLQVLARPYAYAMRGKEPELPEDLDWEELSEVEQGRLAMAIARWMLTEQENRRN